MRVVGWLLTALGFAGLFVAMGLMAMTVTGHLSDSSLRFIVSLCTVVMSGLSMVAGARLRTRSKPLLPIVLTT